VCVCVSLHRLQHTKTHCNTQPNAANIHTSVLQYTPTTAKHIDQLQLCYFSKKNDLHAKTGDQILVHEIER